MNVQEKNKVLVIEAFDVLFNKRDYSKALKFIKLYSTQNSLRNMETAKTDKIPNAYLIVYQDSGHGAYAQYDHLFVKHVNLFLDTNRSEL